MAYSYNRTGVFSLFTALFLLAACGEVVTDSETHWQNSRTDDTQVDGDGAGDGAGDSGDGDASGDGHYGDGDNGDGDIGDGDGDGDGDGAAQEFIEFTPDRVIFDGVALGDYAESTVTIITGSREVIITGATSSDSRFTVADLPDLLLPEEDKDFSIRFEPTDLYEVRGTIEFTYEVDGDEHLATLQVTGNPLCMNIPQRVSFDDVDLNETRIEPVTIENCSSTASVDLLDYSVSTMTQTERGTFTVEAAPTLPHSLAPGASLEFEVGLTRLLDDLVSGALVIETSTGPFLNIPLRTSGNNPSPSLDGDGDGDSGSGWDGDGDSGD